MKCNTLLVNTLQVSARCGLAAIRPLHQFLQKISGCNAELASLAMKRPSSCPPLSTVHSPLIEAEVAKESKAGSTHRAAILLLLAGLGALLFFAQKGTSYPSSSQTYDAAWFKSNRSLGCTAVHAPRILCSVSLGSRPDALNNLLANIQAVGSKVSSDATVRRLSPSITHV
jgi:hypothetical protein